jgi:hypothetical protein
MQHNRAKKGNAKQGKVVERCTPRITKVKVRLIFVFKQKLNVTRKEGRRADVRINREGMKSHRA